MRRFLTVTAIVLMAGSGPTMSQNQNPPSKSGEEGATGERLSRTDRFAGVVAMKNRAGKAVPIQVSVKTWGIAGGREAIQLPEQGLAIIQLHSGKLRTVIDGKALDRAEGEFWVVRPGTQMSVEVTSEAAVLQVTTVRLRP